jgi:DNA-binding GntR family transcriptional regulator
MVDRQLRGLRRYAPPRTRRGRAAESVADVLRAAILDGVIEPMSWLREEEIASELGVSRTPVREALSRLSFEGLAFRHPRLGVLVAPMNFDDLIEVYVVRESLESLAARLAAQHASDRFIEELQAILTAMKHAVADASTSEIVELNLQFHRAIRQAAGNQYVDRFLQQVEQAVRRFGSSTYDVQGRAAETIGEHETIFAAISARNPDAAGDAAAAHIRAARNVRWAMLAAGGPTAHDNAAEPVSAAEPLRAQVRK